MNQGWLPLNPNKIGAPTWDTALHTTISFITNTNQQHYSGETYMSYASQMLGLGYHMFTSAATGIAVAIAFIRGLTGRPLGNFYVDLIRAVMGILLPISIVGAIVLIAAGVPETLAGAVVVPTLENPTISQAIARGPVAHFEIIKQLGENGGGFFAINSAHPFENPNPLVNLIQLVAMLSVPTSLIYTYGVFANNGSGFEGLGDSQASPSAIATGTAPTATALWWNLSTCFSLLAGPYVPIIGLLFLADSISRKQPVPLTVGTLRTDTGLFTGVTAGVILILGALTFFPVLALGPIGEAFQIAKGI